MPASRHCFRIDTLELRVRIETKIGEEKAEKYFNLLDRYLSLQVSKSEFDRVCVDLIGRQNICIHNELIRAIVSNATFSKTPPPKPVKRNGFLSVKVPNGVEKSGSQSLCRDVFPWSPKKGRTPNIRERKFKDRPSPLGPHGKTHNVTFDDKAVKGEEHQNVMDLVSVGSRPPGEVNSVEDGEEVEQASGSPGIYSRSSVRAPLGISIHAKGPRKLLSYGSTPEILNQSCYISGELPGNSSLKAGSRSEHNHFNQVKNQAASGVNVTRPMRHAQNPVRSFPASMLDVRVAMELNPQILGSNWPLHLEKVSLALVYECFIDCRFDLFPPLITDWCVMGADKCYAFINGSDQGTMKIYR
ncbi:Transcriptional coactivator Hfi1/Transcriptional adapter 1 [Heracleum sosnowskyi]|uniref:Transcriptional coactivator Hfi1/Transcriptional adapter 1 n=1 Tax=Heracleum sosnowskyi TaxID=360622 RepID=A0AAD8H3S3_9APIA|nr:Transcriptional coactivator Hfi1/Transcriptional adapter 1 [Heracleum sosnowskyi]